MIKQSIWDFKDVTAGRHGGNSESVAANKRARFTKARQRERVRIACLRDGGVTCRELAAEWSVPMHTISGRFSELKARNEIAKTGVRHGCGVMEAL